MVLGVDIETYSSVDLNKTSVYKYTESPDFDILLFAYAIDDDPVEVLDLTREKLPRTIIRALTDPDTVKCAYNANFERVCFAKYLGIPMPPEQWRCTLVHAATLGLPRSLKDVGKALGLAEDKQKMKEGDALIRYFCKPCKPTKSNGGRTRNLPQDAPDKWKTFIEYNRRDVETERAIRKLISKFPVRDSDWKAWCLDQRINDRGVRVDMTLAKNAIAISEEHTNRLTNEATVITGLDNVNSVSQLKGWLGVDGQLNKAAVAEMRSSGLDERTDRVLAIRQELGKTSVSKYEAMMRYACADNRARGLFAFYGANRTGRWCLTGDHEVLTDDGWVRFDEWNGGMIACWNATTEAVSFQRCDRVEFVYEGPMYTYKDNRIDQCSTPDHKMRVQRRYGAEWQDMTVEEMVKCRPCIPITGYRARHNTLSDRYLRVLIMTQADGHYTEDGVLRFHFKKVRKIERCKMLLRRSEIPFIVRVNGDVTSINIPARNIPLWLRSFKSKTFGSWVFDENPDVFFDELPHWDGSWTGPNSFQYTTTNRINADLVQALAHMNGRSCIMKTKHRKEDHPNWNDAYVLNVREEPGNAHELRVKPTIEDFIGKVYCAVTPTGYFLVRRNGKVWVTGNSGRGVQLQNLPQNHIRDLDDAREVARSGDLDGLETLWGNVPQTLSELIRTAFIAPEGKTFAVIDFSAIEARVIAWLADERWRMDLFANGGDIYCQSASKMFGVPVVKHGVNGHLRQKGKIAELACGYGGSAGAMINMGALQMGLKEEELKPIVTAWREASPNIVDLWWKVDSVAKEVIRDHLMEWQPIAHGVAMRMSGKILHVRLPNGRELRYWLPKIVKDNKFGNEVIEYGGMDLGHWARLHTYGPKMVENIVQGTAAMCLTEAMLEVEKYYPDIVMHIHDEMVVEVPEDEAEQALAKMGEIMGRELPWAKGLLLRGDGYITKYYRKD